MATRRTSAAAMAAVVATCGAATLAVAVVAALAAAPPQSRAAGGRVDFTRQIRPLLSDRCFRCHGPDASRRKAELRLDVREGALKRLPAGWAIVKPGDPAKSELIRRITTSDVEDVMPPGDSHLSLSDAEIALLTRWVAEGAEYKPHWSFAPVSRPAPPVVRGPAAANPIDAFVRARLEQEGLAAAPPATSETRLRRLAFALTGLPPSVDELDSFLADNSAAAYSKAVEGYLAAAAYGERMATDWLDLARYADTYGYQNDVERDMSAWRDWVIDAFNRNLPYDQFLTWQLAGDLLPQPTAGQRIATAFNRLHRQTNEGGSVDEEFRTEYVVDRVNTFGTAVLGLTVECARCHDHRFDPITQREYYSLFAFFNNIDESGLYSHFTAATPSPSMLLWPAGQQDQHQRLTTRMRALERQLWEMSRAVRKSDAARAAGDIRVPAPAVHLAFDVVEGDKTPDAATGRHAELTDGPRAVSSDTGQAIRFSGDNSVVHPGAPVFTRTDAFSIAVRLQPAERQDRAVVLHQSRAWSDAGSRGFEITLDRGRVLFGLIHFWPGNAIAVRALEPLPLAAWSQLAITYDGSSRAQGIQLFLNGSRLAVETIRDRLYKDITYDPSAGDNVAEQPRLTVGARFRDSGFRNGAVDDLRIYPVALTAAEVATLAGRTPGRTELQDHFTARAYEPYRSATAALARLRVEENALIARVPELMVMEEMRTPRPAHRLERGAYDAPAEVVARDTPAALPPFPAGQPRNRLGLARWVTARGNPLAARVVVNRIWRMHFGRGLVATQEDFGSQGRLPTHPELLDYLASRFIDSGWDVKALHRLIVSSATFQQSSRVSGEALARDPDNLLLARGPSVRLPAESIRDSALAASGLLNRTVGGPSVRPYQPAGLWEQAGTGKSYKQGTGASLYRRSLYTFWKRTLPPPSMITFDALPREVCTARRETTATPLQSLILLNDPQFVEAARSLAEAALRRFPEDAAARNGFAFRALLGRRPDDTEAAILRRLFEEQRRLFAAREGEAARLIAVGESRADRTLPVAALAAMTMVVSGIMNFDEFVMVR